MSGRDFTSEEALRPTRRRMLAGTAAAVAALAGDVAAGSPVRAATTSRGPIIDVTRSPYLAKGDGSTDDTAAIQKALDAAAAQAPAHGGRILLPPGVYKVRTLRLHTNVTLAGAGIQATILRSASTGSLLTGGAATNEIGTFAVRSLTLDGARSGFNGLDVHGYAWTAFEVEIRSFRGHGIVSRHSEAIDEQIGGMEARLTSVVVRDCLGGGIQWNGPHDSIFTGATVFRNGPSTGSTTSGIATTSPGADGTTFIGCHVWSTFHRYAWHLEGNGIQLTGCEAEGASQAQVVLAGHDAVIAGGTIFSGTAAPVPGIQLGTPTIATAGTQLATRIVSCSPGLNFVNDDGLGDFNLVAWQPAGTRLLAGKPHPTNGWQVRSYGPGEGDTYTNRQVRAADFTNGWARATTDDVPVRYYRDGSHVVHLEGSIGGGTPTATALTLPEGFRPPSRLSFPVVSFNASGELVMGRIDVFSTGEVVPMTPCTTACLDGIHFRSDH
ncbi:glycosyl hydrolase family 28-related protein [Nocardioides montaniterrae]